MNELCFSFSNCFVCSNFHEKFVAFAGILGDPRIDTQGSTLSMTVH